MIFISIAAYDEPHLAHTVREARSKAERPEDLVFAIIDQHALNRRDEFAALCAPARLRYIHVSPVESRGACWARASAFALYADEEYLLQIDAHTHFDQGWDAILLAQIDDLQDRCAKPIISVYPPAFEFVDGTPQLFSIAEDHTLVLRPLPDAKMAEDNVYIGFFSEEIAGRAPIPGCHLAGGFLFTLGSFVTEIPYDPYFYFSGEEQGLALRAYTHGWDIFHMPRVPLYHLYKRKETRTRALHWHPDWDARRDFRWGELGARSTTRLMDLVFRRRDLGVYRLGTKRSLSDFARLSGIDYPTRRIIQPYQPSYTFD